MTRQDLINDFLIPLQFDHRGPGTRSPQDFVGIKKGNSTSGELHGAVLGLYKIDHLTVTNSTAANLVSFLNSL